MAKLEHPDHAEPFFSDPEAQLQAQASTAMAPAVRSAADAASAFADRGLVGVAEKFNAAPEWASKATDYINNPNVNAAIGVARPVTGKIMGMDFRGTLAEYDAVAAARKAGVAKDELARMPGFAAPAAPLRDRIAEAYKTATGGKFNEPANLSDIRAALKDVPRAELDAELAKMHLEPGTTLSGMENMLSTTPAMRDAALDFKGIPMHRLWMQR